MTEVLPNSRSRKGTVQNSGLRTTRWPNLQTLSKVLKELRELLEVEKWCIRNFLGKWKPSSDSSDVYTTPAQGNRCREQQSAAMDLQRLTLPKGKVPGTNMRDRGGKKSKF